MSGAIITYKEVSGKPIKVLLEKRVAGEIRQVPGGYQYFPKGKKNGGPVLPSVARIKRSLEGASDEIAYPEE